MTDKGPLWNKFKNVLAGRKVRLGDKDGIIVSKFVLGDADYMKVAWMDNMDHGPLDNVEEYLVAEFAGKIQDSFAECGWTYQKVLESQKANWHGEINGDVLMGEDAVEPCDNRIDAKDMIAGGTSGLGQAVKFEDVSDMEAAEQVVGNEGERQGEAASTQLPNPEGVRGLTGVVYPPHVCFQPGDRELASWIEDEALMEDDTDYVVERIVDERDRLGRREFLVKWEGFELNPGSREKTKKRLLKKGDWYQQDTLEETAALDEWELRKPDYWIDAKKKRAKPKTRTPETSTAVQHQPRTRRRKLSVEGGYLPLNQRTNSKKD